jgi:succinate dehydrogenase / fumarate reductase cytochrome b subunit
MTDGRDSMMIARNSDGKLVRRPLSPFMLGSAYKPQITSVLSIMHRITGCALAVGTILMAWWLVGAATSPVAYGHVAWFVASPIGILVLFGWTAALFYHLLNGIRHLAWDFGFGFELPVVHSTGRGVVIGTVVLTVLVWLVGVVLL